MPERIDRGDADDAGGLGPPGSGERAFQPVVAAQHVLDAVKVPPPDLGEPERPDRPVQQRHPKAFFERPDTLARRRLGDAVQPRGLRKAVAAGDIGEEAEGVHRS